MKYIYSLILLGLFISTSLGQNSLIPNLKTHSTEGVENPVYKLFPTQNYRTFIKLNTRNGKMWQVHFTVKEDGKKGETALRLLALVDEEKEVNGRFTLYPTNNIYNFLLLDQIDGDVYQVQWSMDVEYRGVVPIY